MTPELIRERLLRRPGRKAFQLGTGIVHSIGPLGELVSEACEPPTFNEVIRSKEEILAAQAAAKEKK